MIFNFFQDIDLRQMEISVTCHNMNYHAKKKILPSSIFWGNPFSFSKISLPNSAALHHTYYGKFVCGIKLLLYTSKIIHVRTSWYQYFTWRHGFMSLLWKNNHYVSGDHDRRSFSNLTPYHTWECCICQLQNVSLSWLIVKFNLKLFQCYQYKM